MTGDDLGDGTPSPLTQDFNKSGSRACTLTLGEATHLTKAGYRRSLWNGCWSRRKAEDFCSTLIR
jgi:hypothetical protein